MKTIKVTPRMQKLLDELKPGWEETRQFVETELWEYAFSPAVGVVDEIFRQLETQDE